MDIEDLEIPVDSNDFYEILNVPKTATKSDIKIAYHKLSLVFHPDKQSDPQSRASSQKIFHKIHTAYTVLYDDKQKEIYDKFGYEGIETAWQLGPHLDGSEKLVDELKRRKNAGFGEIKQSKTSFTVAADFSEIVDDVLVNDNLVYSDFLPKVTTVAVSETLETSFGSDDHFTANFTTICQSSNLGAGNVSFNWRRPLPLPGWPGVTIDNGFGFGSRKFLSTALMTQFDKETSGSIQLAAGLRGGSIFPQFNASLSRILRPNLVGSVQIVQPIGNLNTAGPGQFSLSLSTKTSPEVKSPLTATFTVPTATAGGAGGLESLNFDLKKTFFIDPKHEVRVKFGGSCASGGFLDLGFHRKWNSKSRASATLQLDQNAGATLRLGITHDFLHLIVPLRFSQEFSPSAIVLASLIPTVGDYLSRTFIYPQLLKKHRERYWSEYRQKRAAMMERKREEAEMACELMQQNLIRKRGSENNEFDLKILEAHYRSVERPFDRSWPVKIPLQFLLNTEGKIRLDPAYRANVLGFFDVAPGEDKETFVRYEFKGKLHEAIILDSEELLLPQRDHLKE